MYVIDVRCWSFNDFDFEWRRLFEQVFELFTFNELLLLFLIFSEISEFEFVTDSRTDKVLRVDTIQYNPRINNNNINGHNIDSDTQSDINKISNPIRTEFDKSQKYIPFIFVMSLFG